jgi:hypothetical protein
MEKKKKQNKKRQKNKKWEEKKRAVRQLIPGSAHPSLPTEPKSLVFQAFNLPWEVI